MFYYGCPNITDYIDSRAFVLLDVNDFEKSYQIIKQAIEEDWHTQRIDVIRQEKQKILNKLAFFPTIENIITKNIETSYSELYNTYFQGIIQLPTTDSISVGEQQDTIDEFRRILLLLAPNNPKKYCFIHSCHLTPSTVVSGVPSLPGAFGYGSLQKEVGINILNDMISNLIDSNSIQYFEKIFVVNIGEKIDQNDFHHNKIQIINYSDDVNLFEIPTINLIRTFCEYNDNCEILYLHTKGVTCPNSKNVSDWKNMMTHFLVNKCTDCFELLKKYDTVGCNYTEAPHKHYSGNFWWANSNYIKRLSKIPCDSKRHDAEWWILSNDTVNSCEIHHSGINHYLTEYSSEKYI